MQKMFPYIQESTKKYRKVHNRTKRYYKKYKKVQKSTKHIPSRKWALKWPFWDWPSLDRLSNLPWVLRVTCVVENYSATVCWCSHLDPKTCPRPLLSVFGNRKNSSGRPECTTAMKTSPELYLQFHVQAPPRCYGLCRILPKVQNWQIWRAH